MENMLRYQQSSEGMTWLDMVWYVALGLLLVAVFIYAELSLKIYLQTKQLATLDSQLGAAASKQRQQELDVLAAKKSIDAFATLLQNHTVVSVAMDFVEKNTLPEVVFSSLNLSEPLREIRLSGQAASMDALSRQVQLFEQDKKAITKVNVVDSTANAKGVVSFTISLGADPKLFLYPLK